MFPEIKLTRGEKVTIVMIAVLLFANIIAWQVVFDGSESDILRVYFLNVGQGDSIFVVTPQGNQILIDGGPDDTVIKKLSEYMPSWDRSIDMIVLTHPHADHVTGLVEVLRRYQVNHIMWTGVAADSAIYREWLQRIKDEGASITIARAGQRIHGDGIVMDVLYPRRSFENDTVSDLNETSIVLRLVHGEVEILLTGDTSIRNEQELIEADIALASDVLKVGHQGSKTSSSAAFIQEVDPDVAIISVGHNTYGHPHEEVLQRYGVLGIPVLRTDQEGDIQVQSDAERLTIISEYK